MSLQSKPLLNLPYSSENLKLGFESRGRVVANEKYLYELLRGQNNLLKLAQTYYTSYVDNLNPTVLQYRDYIIGLALLELLTNCQYSDSELAQPTGHASKVWTTYSYNEIWPYINPDPSKHQADIKYAGLLGTLAFYIQYLDLESYTPVSLMQELLAYVWTLVGLDIADPPAVRLSSLINILGVSSGALSKLQEPAEGDVNYNKALRLAGYENFQLSDIELRVFLGDYDSEYIQLRSSLFSNADLSRLKDVLRNCLSTLKPAGPLILLQAIACEGYLNIINTLNLLPDELLLQPLDKFVVATTNDDTKLQVVNSLLLAYDAYKIQSQINSMTLSVGKANDTLKLINYWLQGLPRVLITDVNRLNIPSIYSPESVDTSSVSNINDPILNSIQEQPPRGAPESVIFMTTDNAVGQNINITTRSIFGTLVEATLSLLYTTGVGALVTSQATGSVGLELSGSGYAVIIATPNDAPIPSLSDYLNNTSSDLVVSNPIVVSALSSPPSLSPRFDQEIQNLVSTYTTSSQIKSVTNVGSSESIYEANGYSSSRSSSAEIVAADIRDEIYGFRDDTTSRLLGLFELNQENHLSDAIKNVDDWTSAFDQALSAGQEEVSEEPSADDTESDQTLTTGDFLDSSDIA